MRTEVHKFGGTSVGTADRIRNAATLVQTTAKDTRLVVVASAMSTITDTLLATADAAKRGDTPTVTVNVAFIRDKHLTALDALDPDATAVRQELNALCDELLQLYNAVLYSGEITPRLHDRMVSMGEKLSIRLLAAALLAVGQDSIALDADQFLETDGNHCAANPLGGVADRSIQGALGHHLDTGRVCVVTGFCGRGPDGATTTLGRGGSDLSATVLAGALNADKVIIWTDVPGVFSTDPRLVPDARVIPQLNYREAAELSFYGAKVLHQRTMIPVADKRIPVWTRSSLEPSLPGTVVNGSFTPGSHPVKGISAIRGQALVSLEGKGMVGVPGVAARLFSALAARDVSVTMISQSSSESSVCLAIPEESANVAEMALKRAFRDEMTRGDVEEIRVRTDVCLVAAVGLGMAHHPGVAARVFQAISAEGVNVLAIAQGSSELNISLAVTSQDVGAALRSVHREFGLHRQDTGDDDADRMDIILLGCGRVGRAFVAQLRARNAHIIERFGISPRVVGLADRSGFLLDAKGLSDDAIDQALGHKASGGALANLDDGIAADSAVALIDAAADWRMVRPVLVDVSNADSHDAFAAALTAGFDVVTANKVPVADTLARWTSLTTLAERTGRILKAEATVGAGLPVVDTLETLIATGDRVTRAQGCFSGTLGFLMTAVEDGTPLSVAVEQAIAAGFTEPDPVVDLSGIDVARKALILARYANMVSGDVEVQLTGLVPADWAGLPQSELITRIQSLDADIAAQTADAKARGEVLRFVAKVEPDNIVVGLQSVAADSPVGRLRGSDNLVVFESDRYSDRPLVVSGPGAGIEVTAMGVLGDLLRIVGERR